MHRKELPLELKIAFEELKKFKNNLEKTEKYNFDYDIENEFHKFENNLEKTAEYHFDYADENKFHKLERSLKKFNMLAYKKLYFYYYPSLKSGNFLGELVSTNEEKNIQTYELKLPTEPVFSAVHGDIKLIYTVYKNEKIVMLNTITPEDILTEGSQSELVTYKGVMVSKEHSEKDLFKINLLNMLNK
jgi:mRNA-degrading endonuclease RelE of RelBE toxin-antitoxin system